MLGSIIYRLLVSNFELATYIGRFRLTAAALTERRKFQHFVCIYSYFRWADDIVDAPQREEQEIKSFCIQQKKLLDKQREPEHILEHALYHSLSDPMIGDSLQEICLTMFASLSFDAHRPSFVLSKQELQQQIL